MLPRTIHERGLVWKWKQPAGRHATLRDGSINRHAQTITGASYAGARLSLGLSFDGTNDHVSFQDLMNYDRLQAFSVLLTVQKPNTTERYMMSRQINTGNQEGWSFSLADRLYLQIRNDNGNRILVSTAASSISANRVYRMGFTYTGSSNAAGCRLFINGSRMPMTTVEDTLVSSISNAGPTSLGSRAGAAQWFDGVIEHLMLYSRALSDSEVMHLHSGLRAA